MNQSTLTNWAMKSKQICVCSLNLYWKRALGLSWSCATMDTALNCVEWRKQWATPDKQHNEMSGLRSPRWPLTSSQGGQHDAWPSKLNSVDGIGKISIVKTTFPILHYGKNCVGSLIGHFECNPIAHQNNQLLEYLSCGWTVKPPECNTAYRWLI